VHHSVKVSPDLSESSSAASFDLLGQVLERTLVVLSVFATFELVDANLNHPAKFFTFPLVHGGRLLPPVPQ
jgi:hypothetical protein